MEKNQPGQIIVSLNLIASKLLICIEANNDGVLGRVDGIYKASKFISLFNQHFLRSIQW